MEYKTTTRLFSGKYQYKIVLICSTAAIFRSGDSAKILASLKEIETGKANGRLYSVLRSRNSVKSQEELDYAFNLQKKLATLTDISVRVESPWVSIYSNSLQDIAALAALGEGNVKYICKPPNDMLLEEGTIIMPNINHDFCVTLGNITSEQSAFVQWAEGNPNLRLTVSCRVALMQLRSCGGSYFYVTGANNLLAVRMHLGGCIAKVERIVKA
jgi:hypothetical protein